MSDPTKLIRWFQATHWVVQTESKDMTHADSLIQPEFNANSFNWVLGHMLNGRNNIHTALNLPPALPPEQTAVYDRETDGLVDNDTAVPFQTLLAAYDDSQAQVLAALETVPPETWDARRDERNTVGEWVTFLLWHETFHAGQLNVLRQLSQNDKTI